MNQQRSRRFRAAQEAVDKEEERKEGIKIFESIGKVVSDEVKNHKSWDTNAITPGRPCPLEVNGDQTDFIKGHHSWICYLLH